MAEPRPAATRPQIEVDAIQVARGLGLPVEEFRQLMDSGRIRTLSERGTGTEAGLYRLSFWHAGRRYRVVSDAQGRVLSTESR